MKKILRLALTAALALAAGLLIAAVNVLKVGDPAPKLQTGKFVQGDPVSQFLPGTAYLIEFWAAASAPSRAAIPRVSQIDAKFKKSGLIVIAQDCAEPDDSVIPAFVKAMGPNMTFRVALDDKQEESNGKMVMTWMKAAGRTAIPLAFLIDKSGRIAWIGHPLYLTDKTIQDVLAGTFDAKAVAVAEQQLDARRHAFSKELQDDMNAKDWDSAMARVDDLAKLDPPALSDVLDATRLHILFGKGDDAAAFKLVRQMADAHKDNPANDNNLAWMLVSDKTITHPDLALAQELAQRAVDGFKDDAGKSQACDTLARIKFRQGKKDEAVALEQKAVATAPNSMKAAFQKTLDSYKNGVLPDPN